MTAPERGPFCAALLAGPVWRQVDREMSKLQLTGHLEISEGGRALGTDGVPGFDGVGKHSSLIGNDLKEGFLNTRVCVHVCMKAAVDHK